MLAAPAGAVRVARPQTWAIAARVSPNRRPSPLPFVPGWLFRHFVRLWIGHRRQSIRLAEPAAQIDRPAALAAERHRRRCRRVELTIANRTTHEGSTSMTNSERLPAAPHHPIIQPRLHPRIPSRITGRQHRERQQDSREHLSARRSCQPIRRRNHHHEPQRREPKHPAKAARHAAVVAIVLRPKADVEHQANQASCPRFRSPSHAAIASGDRSHIHMPATLSSQIGVSEKMPWWPTSTCNA